MSALQPGLYRLTIGGSTHPLLLLDPADGDEDGSFVTVYSLSRYGALAEDLALIRALSPEEVEQVRALLPPYWQSR